MDIITSVSNNKIQYLKNLEKDRHLRYSNREFVAEGVNIVDDAPVSAIKEYYVLPELYEKYSSRGKPCYAVSDKVMKSTSDTVTPQGVIAIALMNVKYIGNNNAENKGVSVILDNVRDPGNVGTIIRTAAACGVTDIVTYGDVCDPYSPKAVRASMGGIFHVSISGILPRVIYALDMGGKDLYKSEIKPAGAFGLAVGGEARGISDEIRNKAAEIISLPMNADMESLNAGVSLSIALYHFINVLRA